MRIQTPRAFDFLLRSDAQFKAAYGGRGSGKTENFCEALLVEAFRAPCNRREPWFVGCGREIQNTIQDSSKRTLDNIIDKNGWRGSHPRQFTSTDRAIRRNDGGAFFGFYGLRGNAAGIKSLKGLKRFFLDEGQAVSQDSIDNLIPTIRSSGSQLWFAWNPDDVKDAIEFLRKDPPPGAIVREINYYDNPFFPVELRAQMEYHRSRDIDKYQHVWLGKYRANSEARVFKNWRVVPFVTPAQGCIFLGGADWGFSVDPSVLVRCWVGRFEGDLAIPDTSGRNLFVDHEAYGVGIEIDHTPRLFDSVPGARDFGVLADSARPETISYMRRNGYPRMTAAAKGKGSVEDGIEFLKNYDVIVHPRCKNTIDELGSYSWKVDKHTKLITNVLEDKKNHVIDALRYAVEKIRNSGANLWAKFGKQVA